MSDKPEFDKWWRGYHEGYKTALSKVAADSSDEGGASARQHQVARETVDGVSEDNVARGARREGQMTKKQKFFVAATGAVAVGLVTALLPWPWFWWLGAPIDGVIGAAIGVWIAKS